MASAATHHSTACTSDAKTVRHKLELRQTRNLTLRSGGVERAIAGSPILASRQDSRWVAHEIGSSYDRLLLALGTCWQTPIGQNAIIYLLAKCFSSRRGRRYSKSLLPFSIIRETLW